MSRLGVRESPPVSNRIASLDPVAAILTPQDNTAHVSQVFHFSFSFLNTSYKAIRKALLSSF